MMMTNDEAAYLAEVSELLGACEPPAASGAVQSESTSITPPDGLLLASHQLVAETEALLLSCSASSTATASDGATSSNERSESLSEGRKVRNANAARRRLKYCNKIQSERQLLKQQEKELTVTVAKLQATQRDTQLVLKRTRSMPVWRAIANRQLQSRLVAETKRRRLRDAVAARSKLIQELGDKVQQHLNRAVKSLQKENTAEQGLSLIGPDDSTLFDRYLEELDVAYSQVDSILTSWGADDTALVSFSPDPKFLRDGDAEYFESLNVDLIPFDFHSTGQAVWQATQLLHKNRHHYSDGCDVDDTLVAKFRVPGPCDSDQPSSLLIRMVFRRYVDVGRSIILWRAHTKGEGELHDLQADETGWSVVRPTDTVTKQSIGMPTAILNFTRFVPSSNSGAAVDKKTGKVGQFVQLAEAAGNDYGLEVVRMMESLLLDDSRTHCPRPVY